LLRNDTGFTLIEILILLVVLGILGSTMVLTLMNTVQKTPLMLTDAVALQTARQCMEWFTGQRQLNGYTSFSCPSSAVPSFCTSPSGYTLSVSLTCTTISGDANYQTLTVTVSGNGNATLSTLFASY
jgi:type II secretory pathway pseudopilin PulG